MLTHAHTYTPFSPQLVLQSCPIAATPVQTQERQRSRAMRPPKHNPDKAHCFLTHCSLNPEPRRANVSEETPYSWTTEVSVHASGPPQGVAREQGHPGRPNPPLTRATLGQLCAASWVSRSGPAATQPGIKPGSVVTP